MSSKLKTFFSEKIIRLIFYHIVFIILTTCFTTYIDYYYSQYYEKPAKAQIENQNNKRILADIIQKNLLLIESNYRGLLLSNNHRHLEMIHDKINDSLSACESILSVLKEGGIYDHIQLVNFYNKDEIKVRIEFHKPKLENIPIEVIDLSPKLHEMQSLTDLTCKYMNDRINAGDNNTEYGYNINLTSKQMESLFLRSREIGNKIYYDIKQANDHSESIISEASNRATKTLVLVNSIANALIILLAFLIAAKIYNILQSQKQASKTVNTILENLPFGIFVVDMDKNIIKVNKTAKELIGSCDDNLIGEACYNIICPDGKEYCPINKTDSKPVSIEKTIINKHNERVPVIKTAIPLILDGQKVILEAFTDISEQKSMQKMLLEAKIKLETYNQDLEKTVDERTIDLREAMDNLNNTQAQLIQAEKMASVGQLAAGIAHEINNPVGFIKSNLNVFMLYVADIIRIVEEYEKLNKKCLSEETFTEMTQEISRVKEELDIEYELNETTKLLSDSIDGVDRITRIITDLKDFSHINRPDACEEDINIIMDKTISVAWNELKYNATIERNFGEIPLLSCYGGQIGQVFLNILINASHAIGKEGTIKISTMYENDSIIIEVTDNGCGIPKENISKIFDPFFTTKEIGKGTGLGLNLAYKIIESHNGKFTVTSKVGEGTTFRIELPLSVNDETEQDTEAQTSSI